MKLKNPRIFLWIILGIAAMIGVYFLPPVHSRLAWRLENLRVEIDRTLNPPSEVVFVPATVAADAPTRIPFTETPTQAPTPTADIAAPTLTPTATPVPLPEKVDLDGVEYYVSQCNRWNYCGPSTLAMGLNFWGWTGTRDDVAAVIKPGVDDPKLNFIQRGRTDLNVMPLEMVDFVNEQTEYRALYRYGGNERLLKTLIAGGYPVIIEKGYYQRDTTGSYTWMGHYAYVTGYDDAEEYFIWQDVYIPLEQCDGDIKSIGGNKHLPYDEFIESWRGFNYLFIVIYPPENESEVIGLLGDWNDPMFASQQALKSADADIQANLQGIDLYYAWFNKGTSYVQLTDYVSAASAFDQAFQVYAEIPEDDRPWRMVWYQTSPYWAYFYTGRYADVISLADLTLSTPSTGPTLEESLFWRALAEYALGDYNAAYADMLESVRLNPNFSPGLFYLEQWGVQ